MSKLKAIFGGGGKDDGATAAEGADDSSGTDAQQVAAQPVAQPAPTPTTPPPAPETFSSLDEYASTLPEPDFVDPASVKAESEAA